MDHLLGIGDNGKVYSVPVNALPGSRGDGVPITTLVDLSGGVQGKPVRLLHYFAGSPETRLLISTSDAFGFITKAGDMVSRLKGGKSFITLNDGAAPLPPRVVTDTAGAIACLSEKGRVLVFGIDEMKVLTNGGRGVILMELEPKEKMLAAQPITQKGVNVIGTWSGDKARTVELFASGLEPHFGKRARKGKALSARLKAQDLAMRATDAS